MWPCWLSKTSFFAFWTKFSKFEKKYFNSAKTLHQLWKISSPLHPPLKKEKNFPFKVVSGLLIPPYAQLWPFGLIFSNVSQTPIYFPQSLMLGLIISTPFWSSLKDWFKSIALNPSIYFVGVSPLSRNHSPTSHFEGRPLLSNHLLFQKSRPTENLPPILLQNFPLPLNVFGLAYQISPNIHWWA